MAKSLKLNSDLWKRVERQCSRRLPATSSPEEFVEHMIEQELARLTEDGQGEAAKEVERQLRGLGYSGVTSGTIAWSLAAISVLWGLAAFLVFRRFTDRAALRTVGKRLYAHLLEIRLYSEEPALVWGAQKALLIVDNLRLLSADGLEIRLLIMGAALCFSVWSSRFHLRLELRLRVGHSTVVTAQLSAEAELPVNDAQYLLHAPPGIAVETPAVRDFAERQLTWRIRALTSVRGNLLLNLPGGSVLTRSIAAGGRTLWPNRRREASAGSAWVEVDYPRTNVERSLASPLPLARLVSDPFNRRCCRSQSCVRVSARSTDQAPEPCSRIAAAIANTRRWNSNPSPFCWPAPVHE